MCLPLVNVIFSAFYLGRYYTRYQAPSRTQNVVLYGMKVSSALGSFVLGYNFYVYLITGRRFRSELYKLLCYYSRSQFPSFSAGAANSNDPRISRRVRSDTPS